MVRALGRVVVRLVARVAARRCGNVVVVAMTLCTRDRGMHARQRPMSIDRVIELRVEPVGSRVACGAVMRKIKLHMRRVLTVVEIGLVAREAGGGCAFEHVVHVTRRAGQRCVCAGKRVTGYLQVIELRVKPRAHCVTRLAGGWEVGRDVVKHRSVKVFLMAGVAGG